MKLRTIGCVELNSIGMGMQTADEMVKAANVELVLAKTTCPGRYLIIVTGDTGAVTSSVDTGLALGADLVVDSFIIPNVHEDVIPAMNGTAIQGRINAIGVIETYTAASCVDVYKRQPSARATRWPGHGRGGVPQCRRRHHGR